MVRVFEALVPYELVHDFRRKVDAGGLRTQEMSEYEIEAFSLARLVILDWIARPPGGRLQTFQKPKHDFPAALNRIAPRFAHDKLTHSVHKTLNHPTGPVNVALVTRAAAAPGEDEPGDGAAARETLQGSVARRHR